MTSNQKLEASREARQWIKIGLSAVGLAALIDPNGTKNVAIKAKDKLVSLWKK